MIEHLFELEKPSDPRNIAPGRGVKRAVGTDLRGLAAVMTRIVAMVAIASLLILVLLPAALAVQAARGA